MTTTVEITTTPEPHLIPGYTGYCPQYRYTCGETYGNVTHKLLLDPTIHHAKTLIVSNNITEDHDTSRPTKDDINVVTARSKKRDITYQHPMIPGYQGFMPKLNSQLGQRFSVMATEGLAEFDRQHRKNKEARHRLEKVVAIQGGQAEPQTLDDRLLFKSEYKLPLLIVRPEYARMMSCSPVKEPSEVPRNHSILPYFMNNDNEKKYFVSGYTGHIPFGYSHFGATHSPQSNRALCEFTSNYRMRQSAEWAPATISRPDPPCFIQPAEIYHKQVGLIPNYLGHIPGANFRHGKTFGADTTDAKRWLRGDFSI
ncbi:hypothetical protein PV327_005316 [Microctonus hyperodae]|uniref:Ciliary microtubule inner protein 2A-C-like domain-containing protein n=1 Tax=Microctonus hyperodae TaxID=165561 RepID=A0AA39KZP6_MICHY|nr:hypothetical protein PV327_005316 [Microctonus hyperodae]